MSASATEERDTTAHNKAVTTSNDARDYRRRVKWLTEQGDEVTSTQDQGFNRLRKKSNSDNAGSFDGLVESPSQNVKLHVADEIFAQPRRPFLPSLTSKLAKLPRRLQDTQNQEQPDISDQKISHDHPMMSSKDTNSSSESDSLIRKEDTFIVTDKENTFGVKRPTEELRLRKAIVLAQANARHAVKQFHNEYVYSQPSLNHQVTIPRNRSHHKQPRSYIKNISSEVRNNKGEKIYFHWTEGILSGGMHAPRVPQGVIKLYEYKKKRLKQKHAIFLNSKSAPNSKQELDTFQTEILRQEKRGKTANDDVLYQKRGSASANKRRSKARVAFVMSGNENKSMEVRKANRLPLSLSVIKKAQLLRLNSMEQDNLQSNDGQFDEEKTSIHNKHATILADSSETSYYTNPVRTGTCTRQISALIEPNSSISQRPLLETDDSKNTPWLPRGSNKREQCVSKLEGYRKQRKERSEESSQILINNSVNNNNNSTRSSENDAGILDFSSNHESIIAQRAQLPRDAGFDLKYRDIISVHRIGPPNAQSINEFQLNRLANCFKDNDLSSSYRDTQMYCGNSTTKVVDQVADARLPAFDQAQNVDLDSETQANQSSPRGSGSRVDSVLIGSSMSTRTRGSFQGNISVDCPKRIDRQLEQSGVTVDNSVKPNNKNNHTNEEPSQRTSVQQDTSNCQKMCSTDTNNIRNEQDRHTDTTGTCVNHLSAETQNSQFSVGERVDKSSNNDVPRIESRARDELCAEARNSKQTHGGVVVSNVHIDPRFVNKSVQADTRDKTWDPDTQPERFLCEHDTQSVVTNLKLGSGVVACTCVERSQLDASVATATGNANTCVTTTTGRREQAEGKNRSPCSIDSLYDLNSQENGACQHELEQNDLSQHSKLQKKEHFAHTEGSSSQPEPLDNTHSKLVIKPGILENPHKHVDSERHVCESITNGLSGNLLKLNLIDIKGDEETIAPALSISRYINETDLPQGQSNSLNSAQNSRSIATSVVSRTQEKILKILPRNKEATLRLCSEMEKSNNRASDEGRHTKDLNIATSVNSEFKVQESCVNSGSCEATSINRHRSVHNRQFISNKIIPGFSSCEISIDGGSSFNCEQFISANGTTSGDKIENIYFPHNDDISLSTYCDTNVHIAPKIISDQVKCVLNDKREPSISVNKDTEYCKTESPQKLECGGNNNNQHIKANRKEKSKKRESLSLSTQNVEFVNTTNQRETQNNESISSDVYLKMNKILKNKDTKTERSVFAHKKMTNEMEMDLIKHNSGSTQRSTSRPKTAGLSAFGKQICEDAWSIRRDGEEDEDDDDDHIQFIEGEQDFFKVFGYNEETVAILNATKVYPVSGSVDPSWQFGQSESEVATANDVYADDRGSKSVLSGVLLNNDVDVNSDATNCVFANGVANYDNCIVNDAGIHESKSIQDCEDSRQKKDQKKQLKSNAIKPVDKYAPSLQPEAQHDFQSCLNIYGHARNNADQATVAHVKEENSTLSVHNGCDNHLDQNGRKIEQKSKAVKTSLTSVLTHGQTKKVIASKSHTNEPTSYRHLELQGRVNLEALAFPKSTLHPSQNLPSTDTLAHLNDTRDYDENTTRRRIYSEADILATNTDYVQALSSSNCCSDGSLNNHTRNGISSRDGTLPASKDSKSHVALRNQLATEKHINQTRYHRHINTNLPQHQKAYLLQTSTTTETHNSKPKDKAETRMNKPKDSTKGTHFSGAETSSHQSGVFNPYMQAANRIMSKFAGHSVYNNYETSTITGAKFHESSSDTNIINNTIRRMSHPADNRLTPQTRSYYAPRPRKLEPIPQVAGIKQNHD